MEFEQAEVVTNLRNVLSDAGVIFSPVAKIILFSDRFHWFVLNLGA
jgi:hypothetical protein